MPNPIRRRSRRPARRLVAVTAAVAATIALLTVPALPSSAQGSAPEDAKVSFSTLSDSGVDGSASLTAKGDRTVVRIWAEGAMGDHPTHIHQGTCDDLDPNPEFPLRNVQLRTAGLTGTSQTTVDVPLAELLEEDHLIIIHRSAKDIGTYLACGDIVAGKLSSAERRSGERDDPLPSTGTGPAAIAPLGAGVAPLGAAFTPLGVTGGLALGGSLALAVAISLAAADRRRQTGRASSR